MNRLFTTAALLCALSLGFTSCSKDDDKVEQVEPEYQAKVMVKDGETVDLTKVSKTINTQGTIKRTGNTYSLRNFKQFTMGEDGKATTTASADYYFDFKENDATSDADKMLSLSGTAAVTLKTNTEKGYTLSYIDKSFDQVQASDQLISIENNASEIYKMIIPPATQTIRTESGWCNYSLVNHIVTVVENRTLVISKDKKPLFKIRMNSIYSDGKPNADEKASNMVFYSIDYQEFK
ncbi:hypothetical protein [Sphingobacterium sp.]|uniref:hypothetical protein n=1 Tax=Sphingobacterium sp. TaxID=341027 RepID=UPI0028965318|nr:hypothetical protein [Sphingobacterium sp.]